MVTQAPDNPGPRNQGGDDCSNMLGIMSRMGHIKYPHANDMGTSVILIG